MTLKMIQFLGVARLRTATFNLTHLRARPKITTHFLPGPFRQLLVGRPPVCASGSPLTGSASGSPLTGSAGGSPFVLPPRSAAKSIGTKERALIFGRALSVASLSVVGLWAQPAHALPSTLDLDLKDSREIRESVENKTRQCYNKHPLKDHRALEVDEFDNKANLSLSSQTPELRNCLKEIVELVLIRREQNDSVQSDVLRKALAEIDEDERWTVLKEILTAAIHTYKDSSQSLSLRVTAYEQIKNIFSEAKSKMRRNHNDAKGLVSAIRDADLEVSSEIQSYRSNHSQGITTNLSEKAEELL